MSLDKNIRRKVLLGIFAFGGAVLFFIAIFMAGKKENLFERTFTLTAIFNDVNGLKKGNYVYYSGVRGGIVKSVTFINDSMIQVDLRMDKHLQPLIKKNARVFIGTEGLVGDKVVQIKPRYGNYRSVKDLDTLAAVNPFDMHSVIEKLMVTNDNAVEITDNLAELSQKIKQPHKGLVSTLSNDTAVVNDFNSIMHSLKLSAEQIASLSARLQKISGSIDLDNGVAGALMKDTSMKNELTRAVSNLSKVSEYSMKVVGNLNASIQDPGNKNAISILARDSAFAKDLKAGMENFRKSTGKLDQDMEALQHNILLRRYFKKLKR